MIYSVHTLCSGILMSSCKLCSEASWLHIPQEATTEKRWSAPCIHPFAHPDALQLFGPLGSSEIGLYLIFLTWVRQGQKWQTSKNLQALSFPLLPSVTEKKITGGLACLCFFSNPSTLWSWAYMQRIKNIYWGGKELKNVSYEKRRAPTKSVKKIQISHLRLNIQRSLIISTPTSYEPLFYCFPRQKEVSLILRAAFSHGYGHLYLQV